MLPSAAVTVLIADDDPDAREVLGEVLALMLPGVRTVFAVDGLDAVAVALDVCPWAAILDLGMPG
jgi:CheY-like chemotaxis protein